MIKFAICDDEPRMAQELAGQLADYMKEKSMADYSVSHFPNGCALLEGAGGCEVVLLSDIVYCEVLGRKVYLHKPDGAVSDYYGRLEDLEWRVDGRFFKCHRSYLVNLDYVRGCRDGQVLLPQGERIPASRLRERELTQALLRHMKERGISRPCPGWPPCWRAIFHSFPLESLIRWNQWFSLNLSEILCCIRCF